jgi:hypothetical protein
MALYERDGDGVAVESFENFHLPREGFFDERRGGILFAHLASVDPVGTFCEGKCIGGAGRNLAVESRDGSNAIAEKAMPRKFMSRTTRIPGLYTRLDSAPRWKRSRLATKFLGV